MEHILWISACQSPENKGGIYTFRLTEAGGLVPLFHKSLDRPMYTVTENGRLYVLLRQAFGEESGLCSFRTEADGRLTDAEEVQSTHGVVACHLCVVDGDIYAVNYLSGNVIKLPDTVITYHGSGPHPKRQEASHTHCVISSPDQRYLLVSDLGQDKIFVLDRSLKPISQAAVPAGHGARHLCFSPNGNFLYCINELAATVSVFTWDRVSGNLLLANTFESQVPPAIQPINTAGAIRISKSGEHLYISNRGEDTLVVFQTCDGVHFQLVQKVWCGGKHPRDFMITEDEHFLICTNMESDSVSVFRLQNGLIDTLTDTFSVPAPLCVTGGIL